MSEQLVQTDKQMDLATRAVAAIEAAEQRPVVPIMDKVKEAVADFLGHATAAATESNRLSRALEDSFIQDIQAGTMSVNERITLLNIERSAANDRMFKIISPTFGVVTEEQRAEIQARANQEKQAAVQVNVNAGGSPQDAALASAISPEIGAGLNALFQVMSRRAVEKAEAVDVDAEKSE